MTFGFVGYEILLVLAVLFIGSRVYPESLKFPPAMWVAIPLMMLVTLSLLFGMVHTISALVLLALRRTPSNTSQCPSA